MLTILVFEIKEGKNAQKNKLLTIIYHYLVVAKRDNLNFAKQGQRIKPKTYFPFIYLFFSTGLFIDLGKRDFSWGGAKYDFVGGHKGGLGGHLLPPGCMLKKALVIIVYPSRNVAIPTLHDKQSPLA
jgi:hypothetical protein